MVATLAHGYEGRDARFSDSPKRQTRDDPIEVLRRFRLNDESQSYAPSDGPATTGAGAGGAGSSIHARAA